MQQQESPSGSSGLVQSPTPSLKTLLAVGVEIDASNIEDLILRELGVEKDDNLKSLALSGVHYNRAPSSKWYANHTDNNFKSPSEMKQWFWDQLQKCEMDNRAFIKMLHIHFNKRLVVGDVYIGQNRFYVFFKNENNVKTTLIKKEVSGDHVDPHYLTNYRCVKFDRVELTYRPYIHYLKDRHHDIRFTYE
jgi:hypothetical protein